MHYPVGVQFETWLVSDSHTEAEGVGREGEVSRDAELRCPVVGLSIG